MSEKITAALDFLKKITVDSPFKNRVYLAGGIVRDIILKNSPKDIDVVVTGDSFAGIEFTTYIANKTGIFKENSNPVIFPTYFTSKLSLRGIIHNGVDLSNVEIEAVAPRKEKYTYGNRNPNVEIATLYEDCFRRDLCLNSLFLNITTDEILDYTGKGINDIKNRILRTPIDPYKTFEDDGLRLLRIVRFYARYGWKIPLYVVRAMKKNAHIIKTISSERIQEELNKILVSNNACNAFRLLKITALLDQIIPEFKNAYKMTQNAHHKDPVFAHILDVVSRTEPVLIQRLIALFHDIGKTVTRTESETGVHFYGHEDVGAKMAKSIMGRLKYPNEIIDIVVLGVNNHMRLKSAGKDGMNISDKALRKFKMAMGEQLENMLVVMHADNMAHSESSSMPDQINGIRTRLNALQMVNITKPMLPINGHDLIGLGLKPGPLFNKIMAAVTDAWYENPSITREHAFLIATATVHGNEN